MRLVLATVLSLSLSVCGVATLRAAEPEYSAQSVVDFFVADKAKLGPPRSVCVGTAEECDAKVEPAGLNLRVSFELNSATLTDAAITNLKQVAAALSDDRLQDAKFMIEGHTDALGSESYNEGLSERRAAAVADFLVAEGVSKERMVSMGLGELAPIGPDPYDPANRRVEMRLDLE